VRLELDSRPESVALVRGTLVGVAETLRWGPELVDDLRTAVSEACNNVVMHAYPEGTGPLLVDLAIGNGQLEVRVSDRGVGIRAIAAADDRMGVGLAVISALAERAEFITLPEGGTEVRMVFATPLDGALPAGASVNGSDWTATLDGDIVVRLAPSRFLAGVLGRVTRAVAARSHFSVDRLAQLTPVTDALATHADGAAREPRIGFSLDARDRRLELTIGPYRSGSGAVLQGLLGPEEQVTVESANDWELLHVSIADEQGKA
jgi:anti-sigma regulatory factor (Ser/Thr protein kinase)